MTTFVHGSELGFQHDHFYIGEKNAGISCSLGWETGRSIIIGGSCHKYNFFALSRQTHVCRDKTRLLLRQKYACCDKIMFVATKLLLRQIFVATNIILSQQTFHRNKLTFVATPNVCRDKHVFVGTNIILSQQAYFCRDKHVFCRDKNYTCGSSRQ